MSESIAPTVEARFKDKLLANLDTTPVTLFSAIETRLIELAMKSMPNLLLVVWFENVEAGNMQKPPLTEAIIARTAHLSLIAAAQMDEQLRKIRG